MNTVKDLGKYMILGGSFFTVVMLGILYFSFINLPDGASHGLLAEAIGPWVVFSVLGALICILGIVMWIIGFIAGAIK